MELLSIVSSKIRLVDICNVKEHHDITQDIKNLDKKISTYIHINKTYAIIPDGCEDGTQGDS